MKAYTRPDRCGSAILVVCLLASLFAAGSLSLAGPAAPSTASAATTVPVTNDDRSNPVALVSSYYNAIIRREYARAYGYWESPPNGTPFHRFVRGYADTARVRLSLRPPARIEGAAGSQYARVPVVLVATHTDGSKHTFVGCYVARRTNPMNFSPPRNQGWRIYGAKVSTAPNGTYAPAWLDTACRA